MRYLLLLIPLSLSALMQFSGDLLYLRPTTPRDSQVAVQLGAALPLPCSSLGANALLAYHDSWRYWKANAYGTLTIHQGDWSDVTLLALARYVGMEERLRFSGAGPGFGLASAIHLAPGLDLELAGAGFAITGRRDSTVTVPAFETRLALGYTLWRLSAEAGYTFVYYWDAAPGRDLGFGGPYLSGRVTF